MGAISFSMINHRIAFGLYSNLPWTQTASSKEAYFPHLAGL